MEEGSSLPLRREPCVICNNPVFIAQKLRIDGKLYHRTCFRCARCQTQLSVADYYETHDGQYCCETCPDEIIMEKTKLNTNNIIEKDDKIEIIKDDKKEEEEEEGDDNVESENNKESLEAEPPPNLNDQPPYGVNRDPITVTNPSPSLVAIRRMMFDSYNKDTDDAKLIINKKDLSINNIESSSQIKNNNVIDIVNSNNNNNNKSNNLSSNNDYHVIKSKVNDDKKEEITSKFDNLQEHNSNDLAIIEDVIKKVDKDLYKSTSDKNLPVSNRSINTTEVDHLQALSDEIITEDIIVSCNEDKELEEQEDDNNRPKNIEDIPVLHTINVTNIEDKEIVVPSSSNVIETEELFEETHIKPSTSTPIKDKHEEYPGDLNPFGDDDEEEGDKEEVVITDEKLSTTRISTNPFGSDSEDEENDDSKIINDNQKLNAIHKVPSLNPFDSDDEDVEDTKKPVPLPRKNVLSPEPIPFPRSRLRGSNRSINSLASTYSLPTPRKKKQAPQPPSSPCSTLSRSPRPRKTRRAPLPPSPSTQSLQSVAISPAKEPSADISINVLNQFDNERDKTEIAKEISSIVGLISDMAVVKDDQAEEGNVVTKDSSDYKEILAEVTVERVREDMKQPTVEINNEISPSIRRNSIHSEIPIVTSSLREQVTGPRSLTESIGDLSSGNVSYISDNSPSLNNSMYEPLSSPPSEKKDKDSANLHRKISESSSIYLSKSTHGQWRRKKAPAPPLPLPQKRQVQPMPIQNIRQELHDIEIKQQGLERQGVALENKIRDKFDSESTITPYVEEMVLQLFELVNEKNELFRKQAELMYLRRQYHLEEEHSELEYQIRCLMARPEANKTDSDKELEEQLIQRLVEVVERRDAIVQCLEMDRLREAEEDRSINAQLGIFTLAMAKEVKLTLKKKHKKAKDKHNSLRTMDLDKDQDETIREAKRKKKWYTLHHSRGKHL